MNQRPTSVLHIIDTTGPGGAETVFCQLASMPQVANQQAIATIRGSGWLSKELERLAVETKILDCKGSFNFSFLRSIVSLIKQERVSLIQSHLLGSNVYASIAGIITGVPVVSTFHGFVDISPTERFRALKFMAIKYGSKKVVTVTEKLKEMLLESSNLADGQVVVIPNGIDTQLFKESTAQDLRAKLNLPAETFLVGCLGNIREAKNYKLAIEAIAYLKSKGEDVALVIAGDNQNKLGKALADQVAKRGLSDSVYFLGFIDNAPQFLKGLNLFLLSSDSEGHPLAITQAMAAGIAIVSTRCGVEEILEDKVTALLAEKGNIEQLGEAIRTVKNDTSLAAAISSKAQEKVLAQYSLEAMFNRYRSLHATLLGG